MTEIATLTDSEVVALRDVLRASRDPQELAEIEARSREIEERERRAQHDQEIAESAARAARDPIAQELFRKAAEQAKADAAAEIAQLRTEARLDIEAQVAEKRAQGFRSSLNPCRDCGVQAFQIKQVGLTHVTYCLACHARHRLRCDVCGAHDDKSIPTSWCPGDQTFRCPTCLEDYASQPLPKPRFLTPAVFAL